MAIIHNHTTMTPTKLELLSTWLPTRPWYVATGRAPHLAKAGGFRLDDPDGEVGIEFMVVTDASAEPPTTYHVPMTYRAGPLPGADDALIGTSGHGVLGRRWIYDGSRDPVLVAALVALLQGMGAPQAQSRSNTADPTVRSRLVPGGRFAVAESTVSAEGPHGTELRVRADGRAGAVGPEMMVRIMRVLRPGATVAPDREAAQGYVSAPWRTAEGTTTRGVFVTGVRTAEPETSES